MSDHNFALLPLKERIVREADALIADLEREEEAERLAAIRAKQSANQGPPPAKSETETPVSEPQTPISEPEPPNYEPPAPVVPDKATCVYAIAKGGIVRFGAAVRLSRTMTALEQKYPGEVALLFQVPIQTEEMGFGFLLKLAEDLKAHYDPDTKSYPDQAVTDYMAEQEARGAHWIRIATTHLENDDEH